MTKMVEELMHSPVRTIGKGDTVAYARRILLREKVNQLVVVEGELPVGMLTKKDMFKGLSNYRMRRRELDSILVLEIMRSPVDVINEGSSIVKAAKMMVSENVRGFPVIDNRGALIGIITKTDLARYFSNNYRGRYSVEELGREKAKIPVVHQSHTIMRVIDLMEELSSDRAIVVENDKPVGVITETDLSFIRSFSRGGTFIKGSIVDSEELSLKRKYVLPTAAEVMSSNPFVVEGKEDATVAAQMLLENGIGGMPVVDKNGDLEGMITKFDFVKVLAKEANGK